MMEILHNTFSPVLELYQNNEVVELPVNTGYMGVPGQDGRSVEMQVSGGFLQWRLVGADAWISLYDLTSIGVDPAPENLPFLKKDSYTAVAADAGKLFLLDGSEREVELSINPALFENKTLRVKCINNDNAVTVRTIDGLIELNNGSDQLIVELLNRELINFYSPGNKLIQV